MFGLDRCRNAALSATLVSGLMAPASAAVAGELVPYILPSQQRMSVEARPIEQRAARASVSESFYEQFATQPQLKSLKPEERARLSLSFSEKQTSALRAGRVAEAEHYGRLVKIVGADK